MGARPPSELFVDADPDVFQDVLYFMRRQTLNPSILADPCALVKLKTEGEFFAYDALIHACEAQLKSLKQKVQASIKEQSARQHVKSGIVLVEAEELEFLFVPEGQVLYITHAILGGRVHAKRYKHDDEEDKSIPGCYLNSSAKGDSGDFVLKYEIEGRVVRTYDLAHVGKDHIHCGDRPMDMDFSVPVHKCIFAPQAKEIEVCFKTRGSGDWTVHYYIGYPDRIPFLSLPATTNGSSILASQWTNSFQRGRENQEDKDNAMDSLMSLSLAMNLSTTTMLLAALQQLK